MPLTLSGNGTISDLASAPTVGGTAVQFGEITAADLSASLDLSGKTLTLPSSFVDADYWYGHATNNTTFNQYAAVQYPNRKRSSGILSSNSDSRFTVAKAGKYLVQATLGRYSNLGANPPAGYLYLNNVQSTGQSHAVNTGAWQQSSLTVVLECSTSDYIEFKVDRDSCTLADTTAISIVYIGQ